MSVVAQAAQQACRAAILICLIWIGAPEAPQPPTSSHSPGGGGIPSSASYFLNVFEDAAANVYKGYFTASGPDEDLASSTSFGATDAAKDRLVAAYVAVVVVEAVAMSRFFEQHSQAKNMGRGGRQQGGLLLSTLLIGIGGYSRIPHIIAAEATLLLIALVLASRKDHAARPNLNQTPRGGARGSDESGAFEASERELLRLASDDSPSAPPTSCIVVRVLQVRGLAGAVAGGSRSEGASVQVSARARLVGEGGSGVAGEWSDTAEAGCIEGCATWEDEGGRVIALPVFRATRPALQVELVLLEHGDSPSLGSFGGEEEEKEKGEGREVGSWSGPISCLKGGCEWLPMSRGGEALVSCVQVGGEVGEGEEEGAVVFGRLWEVLPGADAVTFLDGGWCELEVCGRKRMYSMVGREGVVAWPRGSGHFSGVLVSSSPSLSTRWHVLPYPMLLITAHCFKILTPSRGGCWQELGCGCQGERAGCGKCFVPVDVLDIGGRRSRSRRELDWRCTSSARTGRCGSSPERWSRLVVQQWWWCRNVFGGREPSVLVPLSKRHIVYARISASLCRHWRRGGGSRRWP
jgi:hypothetical protein